MKLKVDFGLCKQEIKDFDFLILSVFNFRSDYIRYCGIVIFSITIQLEWGNKYD